VQAEREGFGERRGAIWGMPSPLFRSRKIKTIASENPRARKSDKLQDHKPFEEKVDVSRLSLENRPLKGNGLLNRCQGRAW